MRKNTLSFLIVFTAALTAMAAEKPVTSAAPALNLRQQAEKEAALTDPKLLSQVNSSPEAQVSSGALVLEDPYEPLVSRDFIWSFGVALQSYAPQGKGSLGDSTSYNLDEAGSTVMPSVSLGSLYNLGSSKAGHYQLGLEAQLGYTTQNLETQTSGGSLLDARLNTTQIEGKFGLRWAARPESKFHLLAQAGLGQLSVSQSSESSVARWSDSAVYQILGLGAEYNIGKTWLAQINYAQKSLRDESDLNIQKNNFELGAKILW